MSKHTPGPWTWRDAWGEGEEMAAARLASADHESVLSAVPHDIRFRRADAQLIAASPIGYKLAVELVRGDGTAESHQRAIDLAREFLAAVEG